MSQFKSLWGDCTRVNSWSSWIFRLLFLIWPIQVLSFQTCKIHVWKVNSRRMELTPLKPKTNMRPWKSTNFETETYGNSSWKSSMLGQKMRKRRKTCLQKLPFVNFIRRRMAKDWYLGVCPMRARRDSPIETRQISLKPRSDGKKHERGMTLSILELCTWLFSYKMYLTCEICHIYLVMICWYVYIYVHNSIHIYT